MRCVIAVAVILAAIACGGAAVPTPTPVSSETWAFTGPWDRRSDSSLALNARRLAVAVTGWIQLDSSTGNPTLLYPDDPSRVPSPTRRHALVTSYHGQRFHPEMVRRLAANESALAAIASRTATLAASGGYRGIILDLEEQSKADLPLTTRFVRAFADSARRQGAAFVGLAISAGDTAAYPTRAFFPAVDAVIVMLYDEHWSTSAAGPIASPLWVRRTLSRRVADAGADRIIAALPLYGYRWRNNQSPAQTIGFDDARRAAAEAGVELARDPVSRSLHAVQPGSWDLWMSDAELLRVLRAEVTSLGVTRIALWRLGLEDPGVWAGRP